MFHNVVHLNDKIYAVDSNVCTTLSLLMMTIMFGTCNANVIRLDNLFGPNRINAGNKLWNKYVNYTSFKILKTYDHSKTFQREILTSSVSSVRWHFNAAMQKNKKFQMRVQQCDLGRKLSDTRLLFDRRFKFERHFALDLRIIADITGILGKVCDNNKLYKSHKNSWKKYRESIRPWGHGFCPDTYYQVIFVREYNFVFRLHAALALNLTVLRVDTVLTYECNIEYFGTREKFGFTYYNRICGKLPGMTYFHNSFTFLKMNLLTDKPMGRIELLFQVVDPQHVKTVSCEKRLPLISKSQCYDIGAKSSYKETDINDSHLTYFLFGFFDPVVGLASQVYLIQSHRTYRINLTLFGNPLQTRLYDGPFATERFLMNLSDHPVYIFSSFQGIYSCTFNSIQNYSTLIKYTIRKIVSSYGYKLRNNQSHDFVINPGISGLTHKHGMQEYQCKKNRITFCAIEVQSRRNSYINLTFDNIQFRGPNIDNCRYGGVTIYDVNRSVTALCDKYSQNINETGANVPMNIVSTGPSLTVVSHSYLDELEVKLTFKVASCPGIFIDPCAEKFVQNKFFNTTQGLHISGGKYICLHRAGMQSNFLKFTLTSEANPCAVLQILTPKWQYNRTTTRFRYQCWMAIFQDHSGEKSSLHYTIKSFQHEDIMALSTRQEREECRLRLHRVVEHKIWHIKEKELPGYGDMITYFIQGGEITSKSHQTINPVCEGKRPYLETTHSTTCDVRILSKSHGSRTMNYYTMRERRPSRLSQPYIDRLATVAVRLRAWGISWVSVKVVFSQDTADSRNLTTCEKVKEADRNSILKLSLNPQPNVGSTHCHLGLLNVRLIFTDLCINTDRNPTAINITTSLSNTMFHNNHYYLYMPMNYKAFNPVLSYYPAHDKPNACKYNHLNYGWEISNVTTRQFDNGVDCPPVDRYQAWLYNLLKSLRRKNTVPEQFTVEKEYYTLSSYNVHKDKDAFSWNDAAQKCHRTGAHLATLHSVSELKVLIEYLFEYVYEDRVPIYTMYIGIHKKVRLEQACQKNMTFSVFNIEEENSCLQHENNSSVAFQLWQNRQYGGVKIKQKALGFREIAALDGNQITYASADTNHIRSKLFNLDNTRRNILNFAPERLEYVSTVESLLENVSLKLQPELSQEAKCTMLLFNNLLYPEMIPVSCEEKLVTNRVVCKQYKHVYSDQSQDQQLCPTGTIHVSGACYRAFYKGTDDMPYCRYSKLWDLNLTHSEPLSSILDTMAIIKRSNITHISPLKKENGKIVCHTLTNVYTPLHMIQPLSWAYDQKPCNEVSGVYLCITSPSQFTDSEDKLSNIFLCNDNTYISTTLLCDTVGNCPDEADELFCSQEKRNVSFAKGCYNTSEKDIGSLLRRDKRGAYRTYDKGVYFVESWPSGISINQTNETIQHNDYFSCNNRNTISVELVNDTFPDCTNGEDEFEYKHLLLDSKLKVQDDACEDPTMLPCVPGHSKCFHRSNMCLYRRHPVHGHLQYCRNGAHLTECLHFSCNGNFKCPGYYCVHIGHVCDGVRDCPYGQDEEHCNGDNGNHCTGKFRCKVSQRCIHIREICDDMLHCLHGDDEVACDVKSCLGSCLCINYAIQCKELSVKDIQTDSSLAFIFVSLELLDIEGVIQRFKKSKFMHLSNNLITSICSWSFKSLSSLIEFRVTHNKISKLETACFSNLTNLALLTLKNNIIRNIEPDSFTNLSKLIFLDLSKNQLQNLNSRSFNDLHMLSVLNLSHNPIETLDMILLEKLFPSLKEIHTEDFRICCLEIRTSVICEAEAPWPSNCGNVLGNQILQHFMLSIALGVFCLNVLSTVNHTKYFSKKVGGSFRRKANLTAGYNFIVILINVSDIILSVYLMAIVSANFFFKGYFSNVEHLWRKSLTCHVLSFLYIFSSILSMFSITVLALTRNRLITKPMNTVFKKKEFITKILVIGTLTVLLISAVLSISYRFVEGYASQANSICLLIGNLGEAVTIKFTTGLLAGTEFAVIIINIALYVHLLKGLLRQKQEIATTRGKEGSRIKISTVIQLLIVGVSNILCWAPGGILNCVSFSVKGYSVEALLWITTAATPLNGIVNPVVFNYNLVLNKCGRKR